MNKYRNERHVKIFERYIKKLKQTSLDDKTEQMDRSHLKNLFDEFNSINSNSGIEIYHEPKQNKEGLGAPDFVVKNQENIIGYIEVKKIEKNLDDTLKSTQIKKYKQLSNNLLLTNYIEFIWIENGNVISREILLLKTDLEKQNTKIDPLKLSKVADILGEFFQSPPEKITSVEKLACLLAQRTKILKDLIEQNLSSDLNKQNTLSGTYDFLNKSIYNNALGIGEFSDSIAQTITYGLFLAKLNNANDLKINFDDIEKLIPKNFRVIKDIFRLMYDITKSKEYTGIKWILNKLINIVNNIDTKAIFEQFSFTKNKVSEVAYAKDPYLYFYEDFLIKYDSNLRKSKGVYYTPHSIVNFIVNSLNKVLKLGFNLENGLANREEVTVLDFATGTGTFLLEVIKCILREIPKETGKQRDYINNHILQNTYGFECLMAPYAVAHLKLFQYLKEVCNFEFKNEELRLKIALTNTLEPPSSGIKNDIRWLFPAINEENKLSNEIKNKPILVMLGNPPYNSGSKNNNNYILDLIKVYKKFDFNASSKEISIQALNDDYVKFIRFAEHNIENSNKGLLGIITNNGYLDNITFRGMRYHLLKTFDKIYILNLHGNSRKREKNYDGNPDENVFNIQVGVSIGIFIKYNGCKKNELASVYYKSIKGTRLQKYESLNDNDVFSINFEKLDIREPYYLFVKKNYDNEAIYNKGISLKEIFNRLNVGITTSKDRIAIGFTQKELLAKLNDLACLNEKDARSKYNLNKDSVNWSLPIIQKFLKFTDIDAKYVKKITYRPFDNRYVYYTESKGLISRPSYEIMKHMLNIDHNIGLLSSRCLSNSNFNHTFVSSSIMAKGSISNKISACYLFPLFITEEQKSLKCEKKENESLEKIENFKISFRNYIDIKYPKKFEPHTILEYIYAILNSNIYRTKFADFLEIDFPKIIFVNDLASFEKLIRLGNKLINTHLLKNNNSLNKNIGVHISNNNNENNIIEKIYYCKTSKEIIYNNNNKFINVPFEVYEFTIGSYQVLRNYINCRKGRELSLDEIEHLERVIKVVHHTIAIQDQIDLIISECKEFDTKESL
ncbi:type ISP restriction/modification enzyme [Borrelia sp. P9F1]|uniref:type ISP restriction/modification enzyme n=1 Tax=Borrelia sp. P9F1 TaxID=3058374 RepID=UPI0026471A2E|nr:type ISP restriction/modification enzyme [Borrelia sp. P9F1]WKC58388.1 N-6 DNA methylase [Borrelia sp. P9F1]